MWRHRTSRHSASPESVNLTSHFITNYSRLRDQKNLVIYKLRQDNLRRVGQRKLVSTQVSTNQDMNPIPYIRCYLVGGEDPERRQRARSTGSVVLNLLVPVNSWNLDCTPFTSSRNLFVTHDWPNLPETALFEYMALPRRELFQAMFSSENILKLVSVVFMLDIVLEISFLSAHGTSFQTSIHGGECTPGQKPPMQQFRE